MKLLFTLLLSFLGVFGQAQITPVLGTSSTAPESWVAMMQDPTVNFYEVQRAFYDYWKGRTIGKGQGYKAFKRWEAYMLPRVYPTGERSQAAMNYENFLKWEKAHPYSQDKSLTGNWTALGPIGAPSGGIGGTKAGAGRINFVRIDPNNSSIMYVGSPDGGLWKTSNGGTSWTTNTDNLTVIGCTDIAIDPTNSQVLYLATGDGDGSDSYSVGVLKSTDGGATWNTTGLNWTVGQFRTISRILIDPTNSSVIIVATNVGIYRTTDAGTNWTQERTGSFKDMEFKPGDPNTVYAVGTNFVKSTDNGNNWTSVTSGLPSSGVVARIAMAVTAANSTYVYLVISNNTDYGLTGVYRSTDSGTTFTQRDNGSVNLLSGDSGGSDSGGQGWYDLAIAASPTNAQEIVIGGINIWKSTNGGTSSSIISHWYGDLAPYIHADQHDLNYQGSTLYAANDGGLFKTTNGGSTWSEINGNLAIAQQYRISASSSTASFIIAGHQDNGSNILNGTTWNFRNTGDGMDCLIDRTNNSIVYSSSQYGGHSRSDDGGVNWTDINFSLPTGEWVSPLHQDPSVANTIYAGGRNEFYKSTDKGNNWNTLGTPSGTGNILEFAIAPSNNQIIYSFKQDVVSKSINGGSSWTNISTGLPVSSLEPSYLAVSSTDPNTVWITFSGYTAASKVYVSTNGGASWTNISTGLPNLPCNTIIYHAGSSDQSIYVGMDVGVYYKNNTMSSWTIFSTGMPRVSVRDLEIYTAGGKIRAGTFGRGTWESDLYTSNAPPVADFSGTPTTIIAGQSVSFTNLSTQNPTSYSWSFTGGTPTSSTATNPTITYNTAGTYAVSLTATNASGSDTETKTAYITVNAAILPVANFTANNTQVCPGTQVSFTSTSTGNPTSYSWSFTGGTPATSTSANPTITYNTAGTYNVTLTATNATGSDGETKTGYIVVGSGTGSSLPFVEGFTGGVFPPTASWTNVNAGGTGNWNVSTTVGRTPTAGNSLFFDNYNNNDVGFNDEIRIPGLDLRNFGAVNFTFDVAYARYSAANEDGLEIKVSTDCGQTFTSLYSKSGLTLATAADNTSLFTPTSSEWRSETINLSSYIGQSNVILSFKNLAAYGNVLYIDNVNISGSITAPTANFTSDVVSVCSGQSVTYTSTSTGTVTGYSWSFPGGTPSTSTSASQVVNYPTAGTYNAQLTVSNGGGNDVELKSAYLSVIPTPSTPGISASGSTIFCAGGSVTLTSSASGSYLWSTGATTQSISVSTSGNYSVTVSQSGCTSAPSSVTNVIVNTVPSISVGSVVQVSNCTTPNGSIQVLGSGTGTLSWTGTATGSVSGVTLPYIIPNLAAGTYQIQLNASCTSNQVTVSVTANLPATPTVSADGPLTFCSGGSVTLSSSSATNNLWSTGATTQTITVNSSGTYTVTVSNLGCTSLAGGNTVQVNPNPVISGGTVSNPSTCGANNGSVVINGSGAGTITWNGTSSSGSTGLSLPGSISNLSAGSYSISFDNGCPSNIITVSLTDPGAPPTPVITADGPLTFCDGDSVILSSSASGSNVWSTGEVQNSITVKSAGSYSVMTSIGACFSSSTITTVVLKATPAVNFGALADICINGGLLTLTGGTPAGGTYSGTGVSGNQFNPAIADTGFHQINYSVTGTNACIGSATQSIYVDPCVGINELNDIDILIYPNPANSELIVNNSSNEICTLQILDELGKVVLETNIMSEKTKLDVAALAAGSYQIRISTNSGVYHQRIQLIH